MFSDFAPPPRLFQPPRLLERWEYLLTFYRIWVIPMNWQSKLCVIIAYLATNLKTLLFSTQTGFMLSDFYAFMFQRQQYKYVWHLRAIQIQSNSSSKFSSALDSQHFFLEKIIFVNLEIRMKAFIVNLLIIKSSLNQELVIMAHVQ